MSRLLRSHSLRSQPSSSSQSMAVPSRNALSRGFSRMNSARTSPDALTPALRARIKIAAFGQGVTVAELLRGLLEREFPEHRRENTP